MECERQVYLVLSDSLIGEGFSRVLADHDFTVSGIAYSLDDCFADDISRSSIIVIDSRLLTVGEEHRAFERLRKARTGIRIVVKKKTADMIRARAIVAAGADAILFSDMPWQAVLSMLNTVAFGVNVVPAEMLNINQTMALIGACGDDIDPSLPMSSREQAVLSGIRRGLGNKSIANELDISEATIKATAKTLFKKLGVSNRTQAAIVAQSIVHPRDQAAGELVSRHAG